MLGIPYTMDIDMWSFGCIIAELYTGFPLFPGENEKEQLSMIMEVIGVPPEKLFKKAKRKKIFFDENNNPLPQKNSKGKTRGINDLRLEDILQTNKKEFLSFIKVEDFPYSTTCTGKALLTDRGASPGIQR